MIKASRRSIIIALTAVIIMWLAILGFRLFYKYSGKIESLSLQSTANTQLFIVTSISDIFISKSNDNTIKIESSKAGGLETSTSGNSITVRQKDRRFFADGFITIEIPSGIDSLDIAANAGDIDIASIDLNSATINANVGDINITNIKSNTLNVSANIGDISVSSSKIDALFDVTSSSGDININNVDSSAINANITTGDLWIQGGSYSSLNAETTTGDIDIYLDALDYSLEYNIGALGNIYISGEELEKDNGSISSGTGTVSIKAKTTTGEINIDH